MKPTIRDGVAALSMEICRMADRSTEEAKTHALNALDGDPKAIAAAKECRAFATAYMLAVKRIDDFRVAIERGDLS